MHADAGTIDYEEGFSLINPGNGPQAFDLPFFVVAHEAADQWWGMQLSPAIVEGIGVVGETLANYSALRVVEETYGHEQMRRVLGMWRAFYEIPRTRAAAPLLRATEPFQCRRKAALAMHALSECIGVEPVNDALRRLFEKHRSATPPLPTTLDLYRELQAVTPDSLQSLLHDLFAANTFWELETERATAEQTAAGTWQVTLDVQARKVVVDEAGIETGVPMDDWVEVGVFGEGEPYLQKHRIRSGKQTITVTVPRKPARAGIDPNYLLIDLKADDNIKTVRAKR
jgi:aminopeptidase N